jgi:hypothetical protein
MAQTGFTPISLYHTATVAATPTAGNLVAGELAINTADGKLFYKDSSGVVQTIASKDINSGIFPAGTVSAPSITFIGDTNTGIYSPSADTIAFTEGGVESMRITSAGLVGIGSNAPVSKLSINGSSATNGSEATFVGAVQINENITSAQAVGGLEFKTSTFGSGYGWKIASIDSGGAQLTFNTRQNSATWTEAMRINASNQVGIGTNAPQATTLLHVAGLTRLGNSGYNLESIEVGTYGTGDRTAFIDFHSSGTPQAVDFSARILKNAGVNGNFEIFNIGTGNFVLQNTGAGPMTFNTSGFERMRVSATGNVGIGTNNPTSLLQVAGTFTVSGISSLGSSGAGYPVSASTFGRGSNAIGFTWTSPNIYGTVDNVVEMVVGTTSDYRLKSNNKPLENSLDLVLKLKPITYNPVSFDGVVNNDIKEVGLVAHEVQEIRPSVVTGTKDKVNEDGKPRYQSVNYAGLVPDLIKAIQELNAKVTALEAQLGAK